MQFKDYYEILEVHRKASCEVIYKAYITLAKKYHPDVNRDRLDFAMEKIKAINEAYDILGDPLKREKYNMQYDQIFLSFPVYNTVTDFAGFNKDGKSEQNGPSGRADKIDKNGLGNCNIFYYDGWIYHYDVIRDYMYKIRLDGTGETKLPWKAEIKYIIEGWAFYLNKVDGLCNICKIRLDGKDETIICKDGGNFKIFNSEIYYNKYSENQNIYKMSIEGKNNLNLFNEHAYLVSIDCGWIYFLQDSYLYRMSLDTKIKEKFKFKPKSTIFTSDSIYFKEDNFLWRARKDGKNKTLVCMDKVYQFNIYNGWIYYCNLDDYKCLYKIKAGGRWRTKLADKRSGRIQIIDDWLFVFDSYRSGLFSKTQHFLFYKIKSDGTQMQMLYNYSSP